MNDTHDIVTDLCNLNTYDLECRGWGGDELIRKKNLTPETIKDSWHSCGDLVYIDDVLEILKNKGII